MLWLVACSPANKSQVSSAPLAQMIESKEFVFEAQVMKPQRTVSRVLDAGYVLELMGDTAFSNLPYFGRAYAGVPYKDDQGIKFTSTDFSYNYKQNKKGWKINMEISYAGGVRQLFLDVYTNGNANLQVNDINRDGISFTGVLKERKK